MAQIDTSGLQKHAIRDSDGAAAKLAKDGAYKLLITAAKIEQAKSGSGNYTLNLTLHVQDDDAFDAVLYWNRPITGSFEFEDKRTHETKVVQNITNLGDILDSAGQSEYKLLIAREGKFDSEKIVSKLTSEGGNIVYGFVAQEFNDFKNTVVSEVKQWMLGSRYEINKKAGGHNFRRDPQVKEAISAGNGAGSTPADAARKAATEAAQRRDI